eukprot:gnl/Dysnectes_brevis/4085_a5356_970.p1 GENE.gnl/Dysnectes_brevis/4085_a5356_970~~gnl/Dysnectes_brevis/4085_a5356_970.p1  ORF type:complete len:1185 (-),score=107.01 gnl/Dysnectes_brevis/4085_a5356_970:18-3572(-)
MPYERYEEPETYEKTAEQVETELEEIEQRITPELYAFMRTQLPPNFTAKNEPRSWAAAQVDGLHPELSAFPGVGRLPVTFKAGEGGGIPIDMSVLKEVGALTRTQLVQALMVPNGRTRKLLEARTKAWIEITVMSAMAVDTELDWDKVRSREVPSLTEKEARRVDAYARRINLSARSIIAEAWAKAEASDNDHFMTEVGKNGYIGNKVTKLGPLRSTVTAIVSLIVNTPEVGGRDCPFKKSRRTSATATIPQKIAGRPGPTWRSIYNPSRRYYKNPVREEERLLALRQANEELDKAREHRRRRARAAASPRPARERGARVPEPQSTQPREAPTQEEPIDEQPPAPDGERPTDEIPEPEAATSVQGNPTATVETAGQAQRTTEDQRRAEAPLHQPRVQHTPQAGDPDPTSSSISTLSTTTPWGDVDHEGWGLEWEEGSASTSSRGQRAATEPPGLVARRQEQRSRTRVTTSIERSHRRRGPVGGSLERERSLDREFSRIFPLRRRILMNLRSWKLNSPFTPILTGLESDCLMRSGVPLQVATRHGFGLIPNTNIPDDYRLRRVFTALGDIERARNGRGGRTDLRYAGHKLARTQDPWALVIDATLVAQACGREPLGAGSSQEAWRRLGRSHEMPPTQRLAIRDALIQAEALDRFIIIDIECAGYIPEGWDSHLAVTEVAVVVCNLALGPIAVHHQLFEARPDAQPTPPGPTETWEGAAISGLPPGIGEWQDAGDVDGWKSVITFMMNWLAADETNSLKARIFAKGPEMENNILASVCRVLGWGTTGRGTQSPFKVKDIAEIPKIWSDEWKRGVDIPTFQKTLRGTLAREYKVRQITSEDKGLCTFHRRALKLETLGCRVKDLHCAISDCTELGRAVTNALARAVKPAFKKILDKIVEGTSVELPAVHTGPYRIVVPRAPNARKRHVKLTRSMMDRAVEAVCRVRAKMLPSKLHNEIWEAVGKEQECVRKQDHGYIDALLELDPDVVLSKAAEKKPTVLALAMTTDPGMKTTGEPDAEHPAATAQGGISRDRVEEEIKRRLGLLGTNCRRCLANACDGRCPDPALAQRCPLCCAEHHHPVVCPVLIAKRLLGQDVWSGDQEVVPASWRASLHRTLALADASLSSLAEKFLVQEPPVKRQTTALEATQYQRDGRDTEISVAVASINAERLSKAKSTILASNVNKNPQ